MLRMRKTSDEENPIGYDFVDVISFNYDSKGSALCRCSNLNDNDSDLSVFNGVDLDIVLGMGESKQCYEPVLIDG